jgi:hypothetical protein
VKKIRESGKSGKLEEKWKNPMEVCRSRMGLGQRIYRRKEKALKRRKRVRFMEGGFGGR